MHYSVKFCHQMALLAATNWSIYTDVIIANRTFKMQFRQLDIHKSLRPITLNPTAMHLANHTHTHTRSTNEMTYNVTQTLANRESNTAAIIHAKQLRMKMQCCSWPTTSSSQLSYPTRRHIKYINHFGLQSDKSDVRSGSKRDQRSCRNPLDVSGLFDNLRTASENPHDAIKRLHVVD